MKEFINHLKEKIQKSMEELGILGLSFGIVNETGLVWGEGFGHTNLTKTQKVNIDTVFPIGSLSKAYTSMAALIAVEKGYFRLEDTVISHYPEFHIKTRFGEDDYKKITIEHLLLHRSGLQHFSTMNPKNSTINYSFDEYISHISESWLKFPVNSRFSYSNIGYDLVAYLIQRKSGKTFSDFVKDEIYAPLGMKSSFIVGDKDSAGENRAIGYYEEYERPGKEDWPVIGSGAQLSTINDMAKFLQLHFNSGKLPNGKQLLSAQLLKRMIQFPKYNTVRKMGYGIGVGINKVRFKDNLLATHMGDGHFCLALHRFLPELQMGVLVQLNQAKNTMKFILDIADFALEKLIEEKLGYIPEPEELKIEYKEQEAEQVSQKDLEKLCGMYLNRHNRSNVSIKEGKLILPFRDVMSPEENYELTAISKIRFSNPKLPIVTFHLEGDKPLYLSVVNKRGREALLDFEKEVVPLTSMQKEGISSYLGEYYVNSFNRTMYFARVSLKDDILHIYSTWGLNTKLNLYKDNIFYTSDGIVVELVDGSINCEKQQLIKWIPSFAELSEQYENEPNHNLFNPYSKAHLFLYLKSTGQDDLRQKLIELVGED